MRVLVTGAGGQLGRELMEVLPRSGHAAVGLRHAECDIADVAKVRRSLERHRPDALINCAAWTAVDAAESQPEAAYRVNAEGAAVLAAACAGAGVRMLHVSTDYVFDGTATEPIPEDAEPHPINVYGASKLAGEREVRRLCPDGLIVRTSWLYGQEGPNFVLTILRLAREKGELRVVADQVGSPTWTGHLAPRLGILLERGATGVFHLTNRGEATWHEMAAAIVGQLGRGGVTVLAVTSEARGAIAPRPRYSVLANRAWRRWGERDPPDWSDGLRGYVRGLIAG